MNASPPLHSPSSLPEKKSGCGCCAGGCGTLFVAGLALLALLVFGGWWVYGLALDSITSFEPVTLQLEPVSDAQFAAANEKLMQVRSATASHESVTVAFTAADLNALIARHPDFEEMKGRVHVAMADSLLTLDLSVPLAAVPLPRLKHRWFNGQAIFGMAYSDGNFSFNLRSLGANGRKVPDSFFQGLTSAFDDSFNEGFDKSRQKNARSDEFWNDVKSIGVLDDQLIVTTKGNEGA